MILKPQPWSCLPVAFAKALDIPFEDFVSKIGHDGSEQVYKDLKFRRGFHIQECIDIAEGMGITCTPIEHHYASTPTGLETYTIGTIEEQAFRFRNYLDMTAHGVLTGIRLNKKKQSIGHACAWVDQRVHDARFAPYGFEDRLSKCFLVNTLWRLR